MTKARLIFDMPEENGELHRSIAFPIKDVNSK
jgi:hypothetical protein